MVRVANLRTGKGAIGQFSMSRRPRHKKYIGSWWQRLNVLGKLIASAPITDADPLCLDFQTGTASRNGVILYGILRPMRLNLRHWPLK